jgi:hypothetical protein
LHVLVQRPLELWFRQRTPCKGLANTIEYELMLVWLRNCRAIFAEIGCSGDGRFDGTSQHHFHRGLALEYPLPQSEPACGSRQVDQHHLDIQFPRIQRSLGVLAVRRFSITGRALSSLLETAK